MLRTEPTDGILVHGEVDRLALREIAIDVELPQGPGEVPRGLTAQAPDASGSLRTVQFLQLAKVAVGFVHEQRRVGCRAALAHAFGLQDYDAYPCLRKFPGDDGSCESTTDDHDVGDHVVVQGSVASPRRVFLETKPQRDADTKL